MANDIVKAIDSKPIHNGSSVVSCGVQGFPAAPSNIVNSDEAINYPTIEQIQSKYDDRFDDPSYYYGLGNEGVIGV